MSYINGRKVLQVVRTRYLNLDEVYPIGSIYISFNSTSPAVLFGGTWERINNTFLYATSDNNAIGQTGGEATHVLTTNEMPSHSHDLVNANGTRIGYGSGVSGYGRIINDSNGYIDNNITGQYYAKSVGGGAAHNNMPPYIRVAMWKRVPDEEE